MIKSMLITLCFFGAVFVGATAQASFITWTYEANLDAVSTDPLGIDGETLTLAVTFDDTDVWVGTSNLWFPSTSAVGSISGGNAVTLNTPSPAAYYISSSGSGRIVEALFSGNLVDFIINGQGTTMLGGSVPLTGTPVAGGNLSTDQLPDDIALFGIIQESDSGSSYSLTNESITINVVPIPGAVLLLGSGLIGLVGIRRKMQK